MKKLSIVFVGISLLYLISALLLFGESFSEIENDPFSSDVEKKDWIFLPIYYVKSLAFPAKARKNEQEFEGTWGAEGLAFKIKSGQVELLRNKTNYRFPDKGRIVFGMPFAEMNSDDVWVRGIDANTIEIFVKFNTGKVLVKRN